MNRSFLVSVLAIVAMTSSTHGDINLADTAKMDAFKASHPKARFHGSQYFDDEGFFEQDHTVNYIFGTVLSTGKTAQDSARNFCKEIEGVYATKIGELTARKWPSGNVLQGVMWNPETETHGFYTFRFEQFIDGVPVFRSGIGFLVRNEEEFPVVMAGNNFKEMQNFDTANLKGTPLQVTERMKENAVAEMADSNLQFDGSQSVLPNLRQRELPVVVSEEQLVIWAGNTNIPVDNPETAVQFIATQGSNRDFATYRKHLILAAVDDGEILYSETLIHADVSGTVSGRGTDGIAAPECEGTAIFALPYAEVSITGGETVFADENGNFNIPSTAGGTVTVNSRLEGRYFDLFDESAGNSTPVLSINVANPGSVDFLHNENNTPFALANVNGYLHSNIVRDFVLEVEPTFPVINDQLDFIINTNINASCNAFYDGVSINFVRNANGCNNTSFADVVYHEYGHHLVAVSGNNQGQFGEGSSDSMAVLLEDNPDLALGFFGTCGEPLRSAENFREYPCNGGSHDCGQLMSGCVWDTIEAIRVTDPDNANAIVSQLFVSMMPVRGSMGGSSIIGPEITLIFLELDDDDGDIFNGTPHYDEIAAAFNAHNMMAPVVEFLSLSFPNGVPDTIDPNGGTTFQVDVAADVANPVPDSGILHVNTGSGFQQIPMTVIDADSYLAQFPAATCGDEVSFFVSVDADNGSTANLPPMGALTVFSAATLSNTFDDDFETDQGWTVSSNASAGDWERGVPVGGGDRNDPAEDADGSGSCYVTENEDDNSDVDGGSTTLTSPVLDASTSSDGAALISYFRWFNSGNTGDDTFLVEISNNGGATWTTLELIGPTGAETDGGWFFKQFTISDFITPTNNMRVRFTIEDISGPDIVEGGVDGVTIDIIGCDEEILHGDVNLDGVVDLLDVGPFVAILTTGGFQAEADVNKDGVVDLLDVGPFVQLLTP